MQNMESNAEQKSSSVDRRHIKEERRLADWPKSFPLVDYHGLRVHRDRRRIPDRRLSSFQLTTVQMTEKVFRAIFPSPKVDSENKDSSLDGVTISRHI